MKYLKYYEVNFNDRKEKTKERFIDNQTPIKSDIKEYIQNYCSEWLKNPIEIYRVLNKNYYKPFLQKPVKRYSRDNSNYYTLFIDNLEEYKDYPKRSKSLICSLNDTNYMIDGYEYIVIPHNNSKWAVLNSYDIYFSFKDGMKPYCGDNFNQFFNDMLYVFRQFKNLDTNIDIDIELKVPKDKFYKSMINDIKYNEKLIKTLFKEQPSLYSEIESRNITNCFINFMIKNKNNDWIESIKDIILDSGIELDTLPELYKKHKNDDYEVYTDSECVLIPIKYYGKIKDELFN